MLREVSTVLMASSRAGHKPDPVDLPGRALPFHAIPAISKPARAWSGCGKGLLACGFTALALAGMHAHAESVPSGTKLEIRLQQPLSSYSTQKGTKISGVLIAPLTEGGDMLLPLGTTVEGSVVSVRKVGIGFVHETARIQLQFDRVVLADGEAVPLQCRITEVENAREAVDAQGRIQGIRSTSTLSNRASGVLGSLAFGDPIAAIFTTAASASVLRFSEPEISLPAGTELLAELTGPIVLPKVDPILVPPIATTPAEKKDLTQLVEELPFRTYTNKGHIPSDITNLIFIGSAGAMERAFAASDWVQVDSLTAESTYATIRSVAENQGYKGAPMSTLLLGDEPPAYAYAKTLNTFSKRHHLRIWPSSLHWNEQTVWTSSSTHDIGIGFSKKNKTFIHLIDSHIDNERAKVVNDLIFTGCVSSVQLVARPWIPKDAKNGTGEDLITDGRIAVLQLNDCRPHPDTALVAGTTLPVHGNRADRVSRQTVLTLKNNILRDNVVVMSYSGIRTGISELKKKDTPRAARSMEVDGDKYNISASPGRSTDYTPVAAAIARGNPESIDAPDRWRPPSVEIGFRASWLSYAGGNGGGIGFILDSISPPGEQAVIALDNSMHNGWNLGASVTLDSQKYLSQEFSYNHSFSTFRIALGVVDNDTTSATVQSAFAFADSGLLTSQVAYNLLINMRPKTSRLRPYFAIGPALQLMHLDDAPIKKAPSYFRLGLSNIGLLNAAYNFGSTPPLEGGGIFQAGFNYGGGIRYRITPRWMFRMDYRATLTSQPDFWTKSKSSILTNIELDNATLTFVGPVFQGPMRQQRVGGGLSFTF
jgi:LssY C-terminus/Outer membrane protein beta-barrel domain